MPADPLPAANSLASHPESLGPVRVAALYRFTPFADIAAIKPPLAALCCAQGVKGTLLLAAEGINGTIAGTPCSRTSARCPAVPRSTSRIRVPGRCPSTA
jgi:UPF0176 protein